LNLSSDILVSKFCLEMQLVALHHGEAAQNIAVMYSVGAGGVARSKRRAMQWRRKSADKGVAVSCLQVARNMYADFPHAREVGHVEVEATGVAMSAADIEGHDHVPPEVLTSVVHWLRKGALHGDPVSSIILKCFAEQRWRGFRIATTTGARLLAI
jgi:TPR repeat protein